MNKQKHAFTLVELIVVITILAILGTIAFISLQGYSKSSRDSVRISDVSTMKTAIEIFHVNGGKYPNPDDMEEVSYGGDTLWNQGFVGDSVISQLSRNLAKKPVDPLTGREYVYSVSWNQNEFEILNLLESNDIVLGENIFNKANAATQTRTPRIDGQYNGIYIKTPNIIFPTPSIISSEDLTGGMTIDDTTITSQVINGGTNVPEVGNIEGHTGELDINLSPYNGVINSDSTDQDKIDVMKAIQGAYTGSQLSGSSIFSFILDKTSDEELIAAAETVLLDQTDNGGSTSNENVEIVTVLGNIEMDAPYQTSDSNNWKVTALLSASTNRDLDNIVFSGEMVTWGTGTLPSGNVIFNIYKWEEGAWVYKGRGMEAISARKTYNISHSLPFEHGKYKMTQGSFDPVAMVFDIAESGEISNGMFIDDTSEASLGTVTITNQDSSGDENVCENGNAGEDCDILQTENYRYNTGELSGVIGYYRDIDTDLKWERNPTGYYAWSSIDYHIVPVYEPNWNSSTNDYDYSPNNKSDYPAFEYCDDLGNGEGWRLPNKDELLKIKFTMPLPGINSGNYRSSTKYDHGTYAYAWYVHNGGADWGSHPVTAWNIICVHD